MILTLIAVDPSPDFKEFLQVLGDTVELKGWKNFRGGLDIKSTNSSRNFDEV